MAHLLTIVTMVLSAIVTDDSPTKTVARQRVDLIELNHFIDDEGREVFQQVVFYDWSAEHRQYHVRAWRLVKRQSQTPIRHWNPNRFECTWHEDGLMRRVTAPSMKETWSQKDPERVNRAFLAEDQRRPLWRKQVATVPINRQSHR